MTQQLTTRDEAQKEPVYDMYKRFVLQVNTRGDHCEALETWEEHVLCCEEANYVGL